MSSKKSSDSKNITGFILIGIILVIIGAIVLGTITSEPKHVGSSTKQIYFDGNEYKMGEKIFIIATGVQAFEIGKVRVLDPFNEEYYSFLYDGSKSSLIKHYFTPEVEEGQCGPELLAGTWTIVFDGSSLPSYQFNINNDVLIGDEGKYLSGC